MSPTLTRNHPRNSALGYAEAFCYRCLSPAQRFKAFCFRHIIRSEFVIWAHVAFSAKDSGLASPPLPGIRLIIQACSQVKMFWINTSRRIALVTNHQLVVNKTAINPKRHPVRFLSPKHELHATVSEFFIPSCAIPKPTLIGACNINLFPKSAFEFFNRIKANRPILVNSFSHAKAF